MKVVKNELEKIITKFNEDVKAMRTGHVSAIIVENILVDYYGTKVPLKQAANITVPDARLIIVEPWVKENIKDVVSAIAAANIGVNPVSDGVTVRLVFPPLNEEERMKTVKLMHQRAEKAKISVRSFREEQREIVKKQEKNKEISEDEKFGLDKAIQKAVDESNSKIVEIVDQKEKQIMTI
jgi:ribosome recycling factor